MCWKIVLCQHGAISTEPHLQQCNYVTMLYRSESNSCNLKGRRETNLKAKCWVILSQFLLIKFLLKFAIFPVPCWAHRSNFNTLLCVLFLQCFPCHSSSLLECLIWLTLFIYKCALNTLTEMTDQKVTFNFHCLRLMPINYGKVIVIIAKCSDCWCTRLDYVWHIRVFSVVFH